jgi:hypothetical protein
MCGHQYVDPDHPGSTSEAMEFFDRRRRVVMAAQPAELLLAMKAPFIALGVLKAPFIAPPPPRSSGDRDGTQPQSTGSPHDPLERNQHF